MWKEQTINWCVLLSWHHKIRNLWWDSFIAFRIEKHFLSVCNEIKRYRYGSMDSSLSV